MLKNESKLLVLLNGAQFSESIEERCLSLISKGIDWGNLFDLAILNAVVPMVLKNLDRLKVCKAYDELAIYKKCQLKRESICERNRKRREKANIFLHELSKAEIEVIILKGFFFAETVYDDPNYKTMNDVDILVKKTDAAKACGILRNLSYFNYESYYDDSEVSDETHHAPAFTCENNECVIGLHWGLNTPKSPYTPDIAAIWRRKVPAKVAGVDVFGMCPEDNVLHLCVHLPFYKTGLRELGDVFNVIHACDFNWKLFKEHVEVAKAYDPVFRVLALTNALSDLQTPNQIMEGFEKKASTFVKNDVNRRLKNPDAILESRSVHLGSIEKQYVVLRRSENVLEKIGATARMYSKIYCPAQEEIRKMSGKDFKIAGFPAAYVLSVLGTWRALAIDHGKVALVGLQVAAAAEVCKSILKLPNSIRGKTFSQMPEAELVHILE